jgi:uncharacterized lipoprotein YajG
MSEITSRIRQVGAAALIAGIAALSGCGPAPYSTTTTSEQVRTTMPPPVVSTTTTTTQQDSSRK